MQIRPREDTRLATNCQSLYGELPKRSDELTAARGTRLMHAAPRSAGERAEGQGGSRGIGTVRRMMDHHACPKTRWDSLGGDEECWLKKRGRIQPAARGGGEATCGDISDHEV